MNRELLDATGKRLEYLRGDIEAGVFQNEEEFQKELDRLYKILLSEAVLKYGIKRDDFNDHFMQNFESHAILDFRKSFMPMNYKFAPQQMELEELIDNKEYERAQERLDSILDILDDEKMVELAISDGQYTAEDVKYFKNQVPGYMKEIEEGLNYSSKKSNVLGRVIGGLVFIASGKNPYDNQTTKLVSKKELISEKAKEFTNKTKEMGKKHKGKIVACATALGLLLGGINVTKDLHNKADQTEVDTTSKSESVEEKTEEVTFEVQEGCLFNINDQVTHTQKLQLLAKSFVERGVPVVSEEEAMELGNEGKLAVTPQQLDNWLISVNLEEMSNLTFTKLMADSNTDKEELSSDFARINNVLGTIYTTKEEQPFIFEFIGNKEYSEYIKSYEEAMIQNQKGNQESLVKLIESRVYNPVAGTFSGAIGMLSTSLIFQQANVYNEQVIGQDIMNLYNVNNNCQVGENVTTFFSDDWAEYQAKLNEKMIAAIVYTGSEEKQYTEYMNLLSNDQNDNKLYIEAQVLPYLEKENIQLGELDYIDWIVNNRVVSYQSSNGGSHVTITNPSTVTTTTTVVPKEPTTEEEKKVQQETEKEFEEKNEQSYKDVLEDFVEENGGELIEGENGEDIIILPEQEPIVVNPNMGEYDSEKDYTGSTYKDYNDFKGSESNNDKVQTVPGVGEVVVENEKIEITNPDVEVTDKGEFVDKTTGDKIETGTEEEIDQIIEQEKQEDSNFGQWVTIEDGDIVEVPVQEFDLEQNVSFVPNVPDINTGVDNSTNDENLEADVPTNDTNVGSNDGNNSEIPEGVDEEAYGTLSKEEQDALNEMLNPWTPPVAGEIVDESYEALPEPVPAPELEVIETTVEAQPSVESDISSQIQELEKVKAELTAPPTEEVAIEKTL